jgi:hypothetical protein
MTEDSAKKARIDQAAARALAEAEARRKATPEDNHPKELGGRNGPEPSRYGDWEKGGLAVDF